MAKRKRAAGSKKSKKEKVTEEVTEETKEDEKEEEPPAKKGRGRKPKAVKEAAAEAESKADGSKEEAKPKQKTKTSVSESLSDTDFKSPKKSVSGKDPNFKIASWNINGIRAWLDKDGVSYLKKEKPDVLCVQELKCTTAKIPAAAEVEGYTTHWLSGDTEGYSGVGIYYKTKPLSITDGIGIEKHDTEGRVITAEFDKFYLVNTYIPNSGRGLVRLKYRTTEWDIELRNYLKKLDAAKPVVWCGDLNVAHQEIDIKNAKGNKKNAGFTQDERDSFTATLEEGFFDSFRFLNPEEEHAYTFWAYLMNARAKNVGWRLDYFVLSERLKESLCDSTIRSKVMGSDHCPLVLELSL